MFSALAMLVAAVAAPPVVARIETGVHPCGIARGFASVWVANDDSGTLARINPRTNRVTRRVRVGRGACSVAAGAGFVWVTNYRTGSVSRVHPKTLRVKRVAVGAEPFAVLVAAGKVWATSWAEGKLVEIDPKTARVVRRLDVGPHPAGLTSRRGTIWVGFGRSATSIVRVDTVSGRRTSIPAGARAPGWFARGIAALWITADDNALVHVDATGEDPPRTMRFGRTLGHPVAAPDGSIWVPDKEIDRVFRVDPARGRVIDSFRGGDGALEALSAFGSIWVTSYAGSDVWRYRLRARTSARFRHPHVTVSKLRSRYGEGGGVPKKRVRR